jgi:hypothetical protein
MVEYYGQGDFVTLGADNASTQTHGIKPICKLNSMTEITWPSEKLRSFGLFVYITNFYHKEIVIKHSTWGD